MLVYLAGPISGLSFAGATNWRQDAKAELNQFGIKALSPLREQDHLRSIDVFSNAGDELLRQKSTMSLPRGLTSRDRWDAMRCDVLLVNLLGATDVSIGTVMEIAWADTRRIPIVVAMEPRDGPRLISDIDRAWLAGLFDGEGSVVIHKASTSRSKNIHYQAALHIGMTSQPILNRVHALTGLGSLRAQKVREGRKPMFAWRSVAQEAGTIIREIYPYLIEKRPEAALALELLDLKESQRSNMPSTGQKGFRAKSSELVAAEADIFERYQAHRRGQRIFYKEPVLPKFNPHEHAMINQTIGFRVPSLWEACDVVRQLLAA